MASVWPVKYEVDVPEGMGPGQTIGIRADDGEIYDAIIPDGLIPVRESTSERASERARESISISISISSISNSSSSSAVPPSG